MSVFLRWGILGILSVAALLYVYNASKRMAEARGANPTAPAKVSDAAGPRDAGAVGDVDPGEDEVDMAADCAQELRVAQLARDMRGEGEPLDRLLRSQEIAFQESAERRERLEAVAQRWFARDYPISREELRESVLKECAPAP